ncbi:MAG: glycosyltransferase family 2 protein [Rhodobacteraceae bacterium]|nr:glycosyltransferase family 2 protein [Paracoccaceae bacterium]
MAGGSFTILTMMKDEGPFLLEWLAYHRLIGFDRVWVYSNDCRDGSDAMLDRLAEMGLVRHVRNAVPEGRKPQPHALSKGQKNAALTETDWLIVMDADEFLHVKAGDGSVQALVEACPQGTRGVAVTWRMMGSSGHVDWFPGPVLTTYTHGAPDDFRKGWGVKTLFRPFADLKLGIHRPTIKGARRDPEKLAALQAMAWVNGSGRPMPPSFLASGWRSSAATIGYGLAEIAHFATRSLESYILRGDRGNVNLKDGKYDPTYFAVFDRNEEVHDGLTRFAGRLADMIADWRRDRTLAALHDHAMAWHSARIDMLRADPAYPARIAALKRAGAVPIERLTDLLFTQPLAPRGKRRVAELRAQGIPDAQIARAVAASVRRLEDQRDAREAAELAAMAARGR